MKLRIQNDQITKAVIEASANTELVTHYLISVFYQFILGLTLIIPNMDYLSELSKNFTPVNPLFKLADYKEKINTREDYRYID